MSGPASDPPGPRGLSSLRALRGLLRCPLSQLPALHRVYGPFVALPAPLLPTAYFVTDPEAIRHVLVEHASNYVKSRSYDGIKHFVGQGLLTSEGELWKRQRRMMQPAFHRERLAGLASVMAGETLRRLDALAGRDEVDLHAEMMRLTLAIVGRTLFDVDLSAEAEGVGPAITDAIRWSNDYATTLLRMPVSWPLPSNRRFRRALAVLDRLVLHIIDQRRHAGGDRGDLMSMLMGARDEESGRGMDDRQLRDEVLTMVAAGHETTASSSAWLLYLLAQHPEIEERVRTEAREVFGDGRVAPKLTDLPRLPTTAMALSEALRLYPPVWAFERTPLVDDRIVGYEVPRGSIIVISPWILHRQQRDWPDPERFDPDRFLPAAVEARSNARYAYLPFGGGPRVCIGNQFALMESQIIVAMTLARYRLSLAPGHAVDVEPSLTLRPRAGIRVRLRPA